MAYLTKKLVEKTLLKKSGQLLLRDHEITGFALRVTSNGANSFVWEGRINGRTCRDTLSRFPDLRVVEARAKTFEYKAKIAHIAVQPQRRPSQGRRSRREALYPSRRPARRLSDFNLTRRSAEFTSCRI